MSGDARPDPAWTSVYLAFPVIHPWLVGRFSDIPGADSELQSYILPDMQLAEAHGIDYLPVLFPGFSWTNMHGGTTPLNQIPRLGGRFLWAQLDNVMSKAKVTMIFGAMFDEVDEGTAMFKVAATLSDIPAGGRFVYAGIDGDRVRSDWWMYLLGLTADTLSGAAGWHGSDMPTLPTPTSEQGVSQAYAGLLGRSPDPFFLVDDASSLAALNFSSNAILGLCTQMVQSPEFIHDALTPTALATQMYVGILGREPDPSGLQATVAAIEAGQTAERATAMIECMATLLA